MISCSNHSLIKGKAIMKHTFRNEAYPSRQATEREGILGIYGEERRLYLLYPLESIEVGSMLFLPKQEKKKKLREREVS